MVNRSNYLRIEMNDSDKCIIASVLRFCEFLDDRGLVLGAAMGINPEEFIKGVKKIMDDDCEHVDLDDYNYYFTAWGIK